MLDGVGKSNNIVVVKPGPYISAGFGLVVDAMAYFKIPDGYNRVNRGGRTVSTLRRNVGNFSRKNNHDSVFLLVNGRFNFFWGLA
jgi:hypothetical protein